MKNLERTANVIFTVNGKGYRTTKISLPVVWLDKLGITKEDRKVILELADDKIIISKALKNTD